MRRVLALTVLVALCAATPAGAQSDIAAGPVLPSAYLAMFDDADLRGVTPAAPDAYDLFVQITGDATLDARIRAAAEARGYQLRPSATAELVAVDGWRLQPAAAEAWLAMKAAAREAGISVVLTSAYRDLGDQQALFLARLDGRTSDAGIDDALRTASPPGYSKHHTGFAIDVGEAGVTEGGFATTRAFAWLSAFDFAIPRSFGFIPSYPDGGEHMGPDPEPWELVWVGPGRIGCDTGATHPSGFCDVASSSRVDDIAWLVDMGVTVGCRPGRFCTDDAVTRGEAASMLWRLHGAPPAPGPSPFVDVFDDDRFAEAVAWLWSVGIVEGTSASTFSPDAFVSPAEALTLVVRLAESVDLPDPHGLHGPGVAGPTDPTVVGDLGPQIDRAEFASLLRAAAAA